jgi:hypothetical protein
MAFIFAFLGNVKGCLRFRTVAANSSGDFLFVMASRRPLNDAAKRNARRNPLVRFQCD